MAFSGGAKRSIGVLYSRIRSGHHGFSTMAIKRIQSKQVGSGSYSIGDDVQSIGMRLRRYSASSSDQMGLIKQLRERTSAPIKDVKSALVECNWDIGNDTSFYLIL